MKTSPRLLAPLLLAGATACWVPMERGRMMEARLDRLEADQAETSRRLDDERAVVKERVATVDKKIAEVQKKIDELNQAARRSGADLAVNQSKQGEDLARLRGDLEVEQHRLGELEKTLADLKVDTEGKLAALKGAGALDEFEARRKVAALDKPDDKASFYALAKKEDEGGDKGVARELYQQFVKKWPNDGRAADAGFRAGEILSGQRRWREAILAYGKVAEDFPRSDRAPDALVRVADSMLQLDMRDDARSMLEQVVEKYPKSSAAKTAREKLQALSPEAKAETKRTSSRSSSKKK